MLPGLKYFSYLNHIVRFFGGKRRNKTTPQRNRYSFCERKSRVPGGTASGGRGWPCGGQMALWTHRGSTVSCHESQIETRAPHVRSGAVRKDPAAPSTQLPARCWSGPTPCSCPGVGEPRRASTHLARGTSHPVLVSLSCAGYKAGKCCNKLAERLP